MLLDRAPPAFVNVLATCLPESLDSGQARTVDQLGLFGRLSEPRVHFGGLSELSVDQVLSFLELLRPATPCCASSSSREVDFCVQVEWLRCRSGFCSG